MVDKILVWVYGFVITCIEGVEDETDFVRHYEVNPNDIEEDALEQCFQDCEKRGETPRLTDIWRVKPVFVKDKNIVSSTTGTLLRMSLMKS